MTNRLMSKYHSIRLGAHFTTGQGRKKGKLCVFQGGKDGDAGLKRVLMKENERGKEEWRRETASDS